MTEPSSTPTADEAGSDGAQPDYTPPETQADLDRIIADRLRRQKSQFADYDDLKAKATELDQIRAANQTEAERLNNELTRWQTEAQTWRGQAVGSRIQALAAGVFADPADAVEALKSGEYLDAGGQINEAAIQQDLADLLARKPHWAKPSGSAASTPRAPAPNLAQGTSGAAASADPAATFASIIQGQLRS
jgi:hypothetical protein